MCFIHLWNVQFDQIKSHAFCCDFDGIIGEVFRQVVPDAGAGDCNALVCGFERIFFGDVVEFVHVVADEMVEGDFEVRLGGIRGYLEVDYMVGCCGVVDEV